jgi:hypothetical protein
MEQFNGGAEGDEFLFGCTQHVPNKQAQGGSDAFSSRREKMFEGRTQIGMMFLSGLVPNPLFDKVELILN